MYVKAGSTFNFSEEKYSSWTIDLEVAKNFAGFEDEIEDFESEGETSIVVKHTFPEANLFIDVDKMAIFLNNLFVFIEDNSEWVKTIVCFLHTWIQLI